MKSNMCLLIALMMFSLPGYAAIASSHDKFAAEKNNVQVTHSPREKSLIEKDLQGVADNRVEYLSLLGESVDKTAKASMLKNLSFDTLKAGQSPKPNSSEDYVYAINLQETNNNADNRSQNDHLSKVPVPAAAWLFGSALIGFVSIARRRVF